MSKVEDKFDYIFSTIAHKDFECDGCSKKVKRGNMVTLVLSRRAYYCSLDCAEGHKPELVE